MHKITEPGIYRDFPTVDYFADPCPEPSFSQSIGKLIIDQSPMHAKLAHPRLTSPSEGEDEEAEKYVKAQAIGNAAHAMMLSRGNERLAIINETAFRSNDAKKARDDALMVGKVPVLLKHVETASGMVNAAWKQLAKHEAKDAFTKGAGEVMLVWREGDIWFRQLVDWLHDDLRTVDDFKTSAMLVAPHGIGRLMAAADWPLQAAMAERGLDALDPAGAGRRRFRFVAQENAEPFALTVAQIGEGALTMGRKRLQVAIELWGRCIRSGKWPGYINRVVVPDYPTWAETKWLEREVTEFSGEQPNYLMAG